MDLTHTTKQSLDVDDVEAHGLFGNAAIAAALTVGGTIAMASPASACETVLAGDDSGYCQEVTPEEQCEQRGGVWDPGPVDEDPETAARYAYCDLSSGARDAQDQAQQQAEAAPSSPDPVDGHVDAVRASLWDAYRVVSVAPDELQAVILEAVPTVLKATGSPQQVASYLWENVPERIKAETEPYTDAVSIVRP